VSLAVTHSARGRGSARLSDHRGKCRVAEAFRELHAGYTVVGHAAFSGLILLTKWRGFVETHNQHTLLILLRGECLLTTQSTERRIRMPRDRSRTNEGSSIQMPIPTLKKRSAAAPTNSTSSAAREDGHDVDEWLRAEAEVKGTNSKTAGADRPSRTHKFDHHFLPK